MSNVSDPLTSPASPIPPPDVPIPVVVLATTPPSDPPPPYPSRERRIRLGRRRRTLRDMDQPHSQMPSVDSEYDTVPTHIFPDADDGDVTETTPLLTSSISSPRPPPTVIRRQRTLSLTSTLLSSTSAAPSFAHTVFSAFLPERDCDLDPECRDEPEPSTPDTLSPRIDDEQQRAFAAELSGYPSRYPRARTLSCAARWRRYFRPLGRRAYYAALFHLLILNFPYALLAWVYLFVFTLTGTTTLMALPLGAVVCFLDLFGARLLARGELALQTTFHGPLAYSAPSPPLPIFTRLRAPTPSELEAAPDTRALPEGSFYRNSYAMFTDPTSYQALFYFLVIKPGITLLLSLALVALVPVATVLVLPAPAVLRLARRLGVWQANVAVEGLCFAAR